LVAIEAGATAVIQPGGSINDDKVIEPPMSIMWRWCSPGRGI
jgi:AICAR transformylase/IMP cyclohydrolase PurH